MSRDARVRERRIASRGAAAAGCRGINPLVLMHANGPYTQQALPLIIASYRERGFEFVTLGQMFGVDGAVPFPPGSAPPTRVSGPSPRPAPVHRPT